MIRGLWERGKQLADTVRSWRPIRALTQSSTASVISPSERQRTLTENFPAVFQAMRDRPDDLMALSQQVMLDALFHRLGMLVDDMSHSLISAKLRAYWIMYGARGLFSDPDVNAELIDFATLDSSASSILQPGSPEEQRSIMVAVLARHGIRFIDFLGVLLRHEPDVFADAAQRCQRVVTTWFQDTDATERADEAEARANFLLQALDRDPNIARIAANAVLRLPPGHRLRDVARVRRALDTLLRSAIDAGAEANARGEATALHASSTLNAMAGLMDHDLVSSARDASLLNAGRALLRYTNGGESSAFRVAGFRNLTRRATQARELGQTELAARYVTEAVDLYTWLVDREQDPERKRLMLLALHSAVGDHDTVREITSSIAASTPSTERSIAAKRYAVRAEGDRAFEERQFSQAIAHLAPLRKTLEEEYLWAVLDDDVATSGEALASAIGKLTFAFAETGDWSTALEVLDSGKCLRFRHEATLRKHVLGDFMQHVEADIHSLSRGVAPSTEGGGRVDDTLTHLLETHRQLREKTGVTPPASPRVSEVAGTLASDEAVVVLGDDRSGLLVAVITPDDRDGPSKHRLLSPENRDLLRGTLMRGDGWLTAMSGGRGNGVDPPAALRSLVSVADKILGQPLAEMLAGTAARRVTIIPHRHLHVIPFWALPSLAAYELSTAAAAALFVETRGVPASVEPHALIVGNPTSDLRIAALEARRVAHHLQRSGCVVDLVEGDDATETELTKRVASVSILHFSGHGRSDVLRPARSALEVHPGEMGDAANTRDTLINLALGADWQPTYHLAGTRWIRDEYERWADLPNRQRIVERIAPRARSIELRLEHGPTGTLVGRYEWRAEHDDEGPYGPRQRLSEMWSAGDIITDKSFRSCRLAFLSSCEVGAGSLTLDADEFGGLPAALLLAGVSTVISPLWPVAVETSTLFTELFYSHFCAMTGEVDVHHLVHQTRDRLRALSRNDAAALLRRLSTTADDPVARLLLDAAARRVEDSEMAQPFGQPYDWAAFHVVGARRHVVPFVPVADSNVASIPVPALVEQAHDMFVPDEVAAGNGAVEPADVFQLADAAETLFAVSPHDALRPLVAQSLFDRAAAHERAGATESMLADLQRAADVDPTFDRAHARLGSIYAVRGDSDMAMRHYTAAVNADPGCSRYLIARAIVERARGDLSSALADLGRALELDLDEDVAFLANMERAEILLASEQYQEAAEACAAARELRPESVDACLQCARAALNLAHGSEALEGANRALFLDPDSVDAHNLRGLALLDLQEFRRAVAAFDEAVRLEPSSGGGHFNRGLAYSNLDEYTLAIVDYDAAIALEPRNSVAYTQRGLAYSHLGDHNRAIDDHNAALAIDPESPVALYNRACAYSLKQDATLIVADLTAAFARQTALRDHARRDADLVWAVSAIAEVAALLE